jgi:hypothetical protein
MMRWVADAQNDKKLFGRIFKFSAGGEKVVKKLVDHRAQPGSAGQKMF